MSNAEKQMMSPALAAERVAAGLAARRGRERRFRIYGRIAIGIALAFLVTLFVSIFSKGIPGFFQHYVTIEVTLDRAKLDPAGDLSVQSLYDGDARGVIRKALFEAAEASGRSGRKAAGKIISQGAEQRLRSAILDDPDILDTTQSMTFAVDDDVDSFLRGYIKRETPEKDRRINDKMIGYIDTLNEKGLISFQFSDYLFFGSASRNAENADKDRKAKNAEDDGWHRSQIVDVDLDQFGDPVLRREFLEVDSRRHAERKGQHKADGQRQDRADERTVDTRHLGIARGAAEKEIVAEPEAD